MQFRSFFVALSRIFLLQTITDTHSSVHNTKSVSERFALKLSTALALQAPTQNVIVSPLLVQAILTLLSYGVNDEEAAALRAALYLPQSESKENATLNMALLLNSTKAYLHNVALLDSAIYVKEHMFFQFQNKFLDMAKHFNTTAEMMNMRRKATAELFIPEMPEVYSRFLLVGASVFQAPWAVGFNVNETEKMNFFTDRLNHTLVECMFVTHKFRYAELPHLDAKLVELPFANNTLLKLWLLLPNELDGLLKLEEKLQHANLLELDKLMKKQKIKLTLPKFRAEYSVDLKQTLSELGFARIFNGETEFADMFTSVFYSYSPTVTNMPYKAAWVVNEEGGSVYEKQSFIDRIFRRPIELVVNHPFYFLVKSDVEILFAGHIVNV